MEYYEERSSRKKNRVRPFTKKDAEEGARRNINHNMEKPGLRLLEQLKPMLEARAYDCILSDDSGGRIPSLVLGQAIQDIYGPDKRLGIVFVQGGLLLKDAVPWGTDHVYEDSVMGNPLLREKLRTGELRKVREAYTDVDGDQVPAEYAYERTTHADEVREYLKRMKYRLGKRVLLVTEEINSGESLDILADMLLDMGIEVDTASFGIAGDDIEGLEEPQIRENGTRMYFGHGNNGPGISAAYAGVYDRMQSGFGYPVSNSRPVPESRWRIIAIREEAKKMGHKLADAYFDRLYGQLDEG